jgi:TolB-like protein
MHTNRKVRITAQLIRARDDRHLWAEEYDRDLNDVIALQGEVAQTIADRIELKLTSQEHAALAASHPG